MYPKFHCFIIPLVVLGMLLPLSGALAQGNIAYTDAISQSVKEMGKALSDIFAIKSAVVVQVDRNRRVYLNLGANNGVTEGLEFSIVQLGEAIRDPETKEVIGYDETPIGTVRVAEVRDKLSIAAIVKEEPGQKISGGETAYSRSKPYTIALTEPTLNNQPNALGEAISERLLIELAQGGKLQVVDRTKMDKALEELKLNLKDIMNPDNAKKFGKQLGADALAVGTLTEGDAIVDVNLRIMNTESSTVMAAVNSKIVKTPEIAAKLKDTKVGTASPATTSKIQTGSDAGKAHSDKESKPEKEWISQDGNLRVYIVHLKVTKKRDIIIVVVGYENKTESALDLHLEAEPEDITYLTDNRGNEYQYVKSAGITSSSLSPIRIQSKGKNQATFYFSPLEKNIPEKGSLFYLRSGHRSSRGEQFLIGINDIEPSE